METCRQCPIVGDDCPSIAVSESPTDIEFRLASHSTPPPPPQASPRTPMPSQITDDEKVSIHSNSDNHDREELMWGDQIEVIMFKWCDDALVRSEYHKKKAIFFKRLYYILGITTIVIPVVLAVLSDFIDENKLGMVILLVVSAVLSAVNGFINPGRKSELHYQFECLYNELTVEVTGELSKPKRNRQAADVYIQRTMDKLNSLNTRSPTL